MTSDTASALEAITPVANFLNIEVDADDKFLYCNGQAIGISCNSTYATIVEFIGYVMIRLMYDEPRFALPESTVKRIQRYWFSRDQIAKMK